MTSLQSFNSLGIVRLNILIAAVMLLYTSYLDMKKREVEDKVWLIFGSIGVVLEIFEVHSGATNLFSLGIALILGTAIGMGLYFFGFYGGADGKALIVLALLFPRFVPATGIYTIAPLMILTNGILISVLLPIAIFILNITRLIRHQPIFDGFSEPVHRKLLACFLGYKQTGKPRDFQFGMEKTAQEKTTSGGGVVETRKFDFSMMRDDFETKSGTWVTPGIPLLVFFTAGFFALLVYGDLVIGLVQFFAKVFGF